VELGFIDHPNEIAGDRAVGRLRPGLVALLLLVVAGCSPSATGTPLVSTAGGPPRIVGSVTAEACPANVSPPPSPCPTRPLAEATVVVRDTTGNELGRTTTGSDGSYSVPIGQTGPVVVSALISGGFTQPPAPVTVTLSSLSDVEHVDLVFVPPSP
jgi:hypothetical protein